MTRKHGRRCLFVASGETALEAKRFLDWGPLVTLNRSLEFFDRADIAFVGTRRKLDEMTGQFDKAKQVVVLFDPAVYGFDYNIVPAQKVLFAHVPQIKEPAKGREALLNHIAAGYVVGRAAAALVCLQRMGYSQAWLFGHDGGRSRLPGLGEVSKRGYDKGRFCTEATAEHLGFACTFYPHHPR